MATDFLTELDVAGYEKVVRFDRPEVGLTGFISVHSTTLGPSAGGFRIYPYQSEQAALTDALRLSRGMTYKNAAADLPLGGGKAVAIADPATAKTPGFLRAFGEAVDSLGGDYWTAEDMGVTAADMAVVREATPHVAGLADGAYASGDPSPVTARGVYNALRIAVERRLGRTSLDGLTVALQGLGHVGAYLAATLHGEGARLVVTDVDAARLERAKRGLGAEVVGLDEIYDVPADVFAPCAVGAILNDETIPRLQASVVAGAANNQLAEPRHGAALRDRGVLYAPDYVANGGGIINVAAEIARISNRGPWVEAKLQALGDTLRGVFDLADRKGVSPADAADEFVEARLAARAAKTKPNAAA